LVENQHEMLVPQKAVKSVTCSIKSLMSSSPKMASACPCVRSRASTPRISCRLTMFGVCDLGPGACGLLRALAGMSGLAPCPIPRLVDERGLRHGIWDSRHWVWDLEGSCSSLCLSEESRMVLPASTMTCLEEPSGGKKMGLVFTLESADRHGNDY
jgi:hypothetical protein